MRVQHGDGLNPTSWPISCKLARALRCKAARIFRSVLSMQQILRHIHISKNIFLKNFKFHSAAAAFFAAQHAHLQPWKQRLPELLKAISSPRPITVSPQPCDPSHRKLYAKRPICHTPCRSAFLFATGYNVLDASLPSLGSNAHLRWAVRCTRLCYELLLETTATVSCPPSVFQSVTRLICSASRSAIKFCWAAYRLRWASSTVR